jgi:hypothetical protein
MAAERVAHDFEVLKSKKWAPEAFARLSVQLMSQMGQKSLDEGRRYLSHFKQEMPDEDFSEFDDMEAEEPGPYPLAAFVEALVGFVRDSLLDDVDVEEEDGDDVTPLVEALMKALQAWVVYANGNFETFEEAQADFEHWDQRHTMQIVTGEDTVEGDDA